jgi:Transglutaminase-like superfamily
MLYRLRAGVSYCPVDGSLIFLDLGEDRYFRLSHRLEKMFLAYLCSDGQPEVDVSDLVRQNILVQAVDAEPASYASVIAPPSLSAIEHKSPAPRLDALTLLEVLATVCSTQLQLRTRRLNRIIAKVIAYRQHMAAHIPFAPNGAQTERLMESAGAFRHARRYVPIETSCLLDSLALVAFLARRRLSADLIFGVTHNPFAAHCWVQAGDWVLNDTVGNVAAHTPIRKV